MFPILSRNLLLVHCTWSRKTKCTSGLVQISLAIKLKIMIIEITFQLSIIRYQITAQVNSILEEEKNYLVLIKKKITNSINKIIFPLKTDQGDVSQHVLTTQTQPEAQNWPENSSSRGWDPEPPSPPGSPHWGSLTDAFQVSRHMQLEPLNY